MKVAADYVVAKVDKARALLAEARSAPEAKKVADMAAAAQVYARRQRLSLEAILYATGVKIEALALMGQFLKSAPKATGGDAQRTRYHTVSESPSTLASIGITFRESADAQRLAEIKEKKPEVFAGLLDGTLGLAEACRLLRRDELTAKALALPAGKFRVIYADPPWRYADSKALPGWESTAAENNYPTMPTLGICDLAVRDLAAENAVLFCWATFPLLPDALAVIGAWGFQYKTAFVWSKGRPNFGHYHTADAELLMVATRGSALPDTEKREAQVQSIKREGRHSAKPPEFRALVDRLYPNGPRIELFAREKSDNGWAVWGNEA